MVSHSNSIILQFAPASKNAIIRASDTLSTSMILFITTSTLAFIAFVAFVAYKYAKALKTQSEPIVYVEKELPIIPPVPIQKDSTVSAVFSYYDTEGEVEKPLPVHPRASPHPVHRMPQISEMNT